MVGRIPESFINTITARTDIIELISAKIELRKAGANFVARCPFHNEKTPSFSVNAIKQFYHCFGCGAHGDAIKFLMEYEKLSFVEAIEDLAARLGLDIPYEKSFNLQQQEDKALPKDVVKDIYSVLKIAKSFFQSQFKAHPASAKAISYLKNRGVTGEVAKEFAIGYAPPGWDNFKRYITSNFKISDDVLEQTGLLINKAAQEVGGLQRVYDRFRDRIIFPIRDRRGRVVGFGGRVVSSADEPKYLNSPETVVFHKGKELYGLYEACKKVSKITYLLVVEGYMDVIALSQAGFPQVVATLGTALTAEHLRLLFRLTPRIIFCFDADEAGYKAANRALETSLSAMDGKNKVSFLFLPEGEDPDSFVRSEGQDSFSKELEMAVSLADFLFREVSKNLNLDAIEDRSLVVIKAKALIEKVPEGVFKHLLYDRLAQLVGIDRNALSSSNYKVEGSFNSASGRSGRGNIFPKKGNRLPQLPKSPAIIALALLLKDRSLVTELEQNFADYSEVDFFEIKLLCAIAVILQKDQEVLESEIKEKLPVTLAKRFVPEELKKLIEFVPQVGAKAEFIGAVNKIRDRYKEQRLELLLARAKQEGLADEDKVELQRLLLERSLV